MTKSIAEKITYQAIEALGYRQLGERPIWSNGTFQLHQYPDGWGVFKKQDNNVLYEDTGQKITLCRELPTPSKQSTTLAEKMAEEYVKQHYPKYPCALPEANQEAEYCREDFLAGYAAAHQWIEVTPETEIEEKRLLQFYTKKMNILATGFFIKEDDDIKDDSIFYAEHGGGHCKRKNVSHFRYLDTTPPKQSKEKK